MSKEVTFNPMTRMLKGFDVVANAVAGTLGARGRNVFIDDPMAPKITNDGATIAQNIALEDKVENMGAYLIRNTSAQTNDDAGDGTTTTAVLLQAIVHECINRPENPMVIKNSLQEAGKKVIKELKKQAKTINKEDVGRVALISAEHPQIAEMIGEVVNKVGEDVIITVEDSNDFECHYDIVEGYEANAGFMSTAFINDLKRARCIMNDVPVFVTEKKIAAVTDIKPLFDQFQQAGISQAVIVCEDIENAVLGVFVASKMTGAFNAVVIRATGDLLKDIEAVVGAKRVSDEKGLNFQQVDIKKHLGHVKKIICDANKTVFMPHDALSAELWANHLQKFANEEHNLYIKERLNKRISQLRGGIAMLKIGANTDFEREYLKLKAEDAIKAAKAALEEGVVEGGGMALWRIADAMKPKTIGEQILKKALTAPLRTIVANAGRDYTEVLQGMPENAGYDAKNDAYVVMELAGIIDPTKVERCAVENSISAASTFITTFCTISDYVPPNQKTT